MKTLGEQRIRVDYNDETPTLINSIKQRIAGLIDEINNLETIDNEHGRLKSLAMTELEITSMWITKVLTYNK